MIEKKWEQTDELGKVRYCGCQCDAHADKQLKCMVITEYEEPELQSFLERLIIMTGGEKRHSKASEHHCVLCAKSIEANRPRDWLQIDPFDDEAKPWPTIERDRRIREGIELPIGKEWREVAREYGYDEALFDDPEDLTFYPEGTESVMNPVGEEE